MFVKVWIFFRHFRPLRKKKKLSHGASCWHLLEYTVYKMDTVTSQSRSSFTFMLAVNLSSKLKPFCMYTQKLLNLEA